MKNTIFPSQTNNEPFTICKSKCNKWRTRCQTNYNNRQLTPSQKYDLISQYCELVVDGMDMDSLVQYAHEQMTNYFDNLILSEIKEEIDNYDPELYAELVDNVTNETFIDVNNNGGKF